MFELNLMGSDDVVRAMNACQQQFSRAINDPADTKMIMTKFSEFLLAIRKDLGNKHTKTKPLDMLREPDPRH